jgi:uncharacterized YigZ family protein
VANPNPDKDYYFTIEKESSAEFKDRGSRFIAYAFPVASSDDFKKRLKELKEEHPKAVHHCFAYRIGTDGNIFRSSDDGEPSGSAGRPILGQIDSKGLTSTAVVVVRYFGGTLLGVPGLISAYKTATLFALQTVPHVRKPVLVNYRLQFDYTVMNDVMRILKKHDCIIHLQDMQLFCTMETGIPKAVLELCLLQLQNIKGLQQEKY